MKSTVQTHARLPAPVGGSRGRPSRAQFHKCAPMYAAAQPGQRARQSSGPGAGREGVQGARVGKTRVCMSDFFHYVELFPLCSHSVPTLFPLCSHSQPSGNPHRCWVPCVCSHCSHGSRGNGGEGTTNHHAAPMKKGPRGPCVWCWCGAHAARWGSLTTLPALRPSR